MFGWGKGEEKPKPEAIILSPEESKKLREGLPPEKPHTVTSQEAKAIAESARRKLNENPDALRDKNADAVVLNPEDNSEWKEMREKLFGEEGAKADADKLAEQFGQDKE